LVGGNIKKNRTKEFNDVVKRVFDIILSGIGLVVSVPVWAISSVAIVMESGGPIFIRQKRIGKGGKIFRILKFRSMDKIAHKESPTNHINNRSERITKAGKFLRATAMDELPQLLSIFCGDMSFVGPRPMHPEELGINGSRYRKMEEIPDFDMRCTIRPGLTGIAQVYKGKYDRFERKIKYDLLYLKKRCFLLDAKLVLLSFFVTLFGRWE
jgi:lipopolysaccharide/colanic/teichoic acid biosynthesis glycosyltransferase